MPDDNQPRLFTRYAAVLLTIFHDPELQIRFIAERTGVTEQHAAGIIRNLRKKGFIGSERVGRRSRYTISQDRHLIDDLAAGLTVGDFLRIFGGQCSRSGSGL